MAATIRIACIEQSVSPRELSIEAAVAWFKEERDFFSDHPQMNNGVVLGNRNYGNINFQNFYTSRLDQVMKAIPGANGQQAVDQYLAEASAFRLFLSHGHLARLYSDAGTGSLPVLMAAVSPAFLSGNQQISDVPEIALARLALVGNPWSLTGSDLVSAKAAIADASKALDTANQSRIDADLFADEVRGRMLNEERIVNDKLSFMGPSRYWSKVAHTNALTAYGALAVFVLLLAVPAIVIVYNWPALSAYLTSLIDETKGSFSIASIAVIAVPVVAYGWLLRHVSRLFVQSLAISTDARHRQVLTTTYLGLTRLKATGLTDADRALILNALFRPAPPHAAEEGPPIGLLDLLKK